MKIRPQIEIPNVKSGAPVVNQAQAGSETHFDAALLQAAQIVADSEPEAYGAMAPKVQQALSAALEQLNQKTPSQLQSLVRQPQGLAALTASLAQTDGLNTAQTTQLNKLLLLALPRLLAYKTNVEVSGLSAGATSTGGVQPGPQGGTPAVSAFPADFFSVLSGQTGLSGASGQTVQPVSAQGSGSTPAALSEATGLGAQQSPRQGFGSATPAVSGASGQGFQQQASATPAVSGALGSGFQQAPGQVSGSSVAGSFQAASAPSFGSTQAGRGLPFGAGQTGTVNTAASTPESGAIRVFPVAVNSGQPLAQVAFQSPGASVQGPAQGVNGAGQNTAAVAASGSSQSGTTPAPQGQVQAGQNQNQSQGQGNALVSNQNGTTDTGFPVTLDMDVQLTGNTVPLPILANSQVTLKGDGTWVLPQGASASSTARPQTPVSQQPVAQASSGTQEQQAAAPDQPSLLGSLPQPSVPQAGEQATETSNGQTAPQVQATGFEDPFSLQELVSQQTEGDTQTPGSGTQSASSQTLAQQGQASGNSQVQSSQQLVAQLPSVMQTLQNNGTPGQARTGAVTASPEFDPSGAQGSAQTSAGTAQAQGGSQGSFGGALASFGQNPMQSLADQTLQDYGVQKNLTQQISSALNEAGGANPGRLVIQLSPASLGNVQVDLSMVNGKLTAHLVTSQQDVRDVLARDLSGFKASLESHGIIVNEVSVAVRSNVGDGQQGSPDQTAQNWWRNIPKTSASEIAAVPGGVSAYAANTADSQQGFNALA